MGSVCIGVDIGQRVDPTAIAVVEVEERANDTYFIVRHLERLPLGTSYPKVATRIRALTKQVRVHMGDGGDALTVYADATGVGLPVVDLLKSAGVPVTPVLFTHGDKRTVDREQGRVMLGKAWLVSRMQALLQSGRLLLPKTEEARVLARELLDYEIRLTEDADFKAGAFRVGSHDDLVTALGLACQEEPIAFACAVAMTPTRSGTPNARYLLDAALRVGPQGQQARERAAAWPDDEATAEDEDEGSCVAIVGGDPRGGDLVQVLFDRMRTGRTLTGG